MKLKRKKGFFSISAVAKMFSVHQQTVRLYEKEGLINPKRSTGNTRLFSEEDVDQLEEIIYLTHQLGINLAGVQMILKLKAQMHKMQKDMNKLFEQTQQELDKESESSKQAVKTSMKQLMTIKKERQSQGAVPPTTPQASSDKDKQQSIDIDNWDIDYEDE
jgi:MerR family transcriptional regulator/heat shock protein HspR